MGKLMDRLQHQLQTDLKQDAEDCLKLYNYLKESTGGVWQSNWTPLVQTKFKGFPSNQRTFKPTPIGYLVLKGLNT